MTNSDETLVAIQRWFADQCDGEREHSHGITIGTVDNPGWSIEIDLDETSLSDRELNRHELHLHNQRLARLLARGHQIPRGLLASEPRSGVEALPAMGSGGI